MKLSKSIIKKYGISKKAWSIQRGRKGGKTMARRKSSRSHKKSYRKSKSGSSGLNPWIVALTVAGNEIARPQLQRYTGQYTSKIPVVGPAGYGHEVAVSGLALGSMLLFKGKTVKSIAYPLIAKEVGSAANKMMGQSAASSASSASSDMYY